MELQIIFFVMLSIFFNGMFFVCLDIDKQNIIDRLCEIQHRRPGKAKEIMFPWNNPPEDEYHARLWAEHKLGDSNWIFWNAVLHIIVDDKYFILLVNIGVALGCFVLPNFL